MAESPVTVALPTYQCGPYLRRAVASILAQSHRNLTLVVLSDGEREPPWPALADLDDPRLLRFDLPANRGMYFAIAAVLGATAAPYLLTQDADDWSEPERLASLLAALRAADGVAASSAHRHHRPEGQRIDRAGAAMAAGQVDGRLGWPFFHQALYRCEHLRAIGGYYGGFTLGYDRVVACLTRLTGRVAYLDQPLYNRLYRPDSLSNRRPDPAELLARRADDAAQRAIYAEACERYSRYRAGAMGREALLEAIRAATARHIPAESAAALAEASARLRAAMAAAPAERQARAAPTRLAPPAPERIPLASCTMPTFNRRRFVPGAVASFLAQAYPARELIVLDDGDDPVADLLPDDPRLRYVRLEQRHSVGAKRNRCAELARGEILVHWDDDDWHAPGRIAEQVSLLERERAQICGARRILHYAPDSDQAWLYGVPLLVPQLFWGCCMAYRRALWERFPFEHVTGDEDARFARAVRREPTAQTLDHTLLVAMTHAANVSRKGPRGPYWHPQPARVVHQLLGPDLRYYAPARG